MLDEEKEEIIPYDCRFNGEVQDSRRVPVTIVTVDPPSMPMPDKTHQNKVESAFPRTPFPFDALPINLRKLVDKYSKALQCAPEFMAMNFLTVVSGAAGNSIAVQIKQSWVTAPFLWFVVIDRSGSGKTHPQSAAMKPLLKLQSIEDINFKKAQTEFKSEKAALEKAKKFDEVSSDPEPMRHYYSQNFTIEALIPMYQNSARGLVIHVDELAGLLKGLNQYKGGKGSDDEQFLQLFNCNALKSDRATKNGFCRESGAAVMGGIQPDVLASVFGENERANGMLYRFLPLQLNSVPPVFTEDDISQADEDEWQSMIDWMYTILAPTDPITGCIQKNILTVNTDGKALWKEFHDEMSAVELFMPKLFQGYLPKLRTYCLKFMAVLHLCHCYEHGVLQLSIERSTVDGAIKLTKYFAWQAFHLMCGAEKNRNPYHAILLRALESLRAEPNDNQILLARVREKMNELLPIGMQIEPTQNKRVATWAKEIGMVISTRADNKTVVSLV